MTVNSLDKETVELVSSTLWMEEQLDLTLFHITNFTLGPANASDPKQGVKMVTRMRRKVTTEMMTTYFPTILLMAITYATTFFKPIFFEASLTVNLTTMLVMTTIFISKMEGLPSTSDIKMIDIWLILCQLVPFVQVVLLTLKERLREEKQEEDVVLEKDQIQQPVAMNVDVEGDITAKEAWTISEITPQKAASLTMLTMIGKVLVRFLIF